MPNEKKLTLGNKLTIVVIIIMVVIGAFTIYSVVKDFFPKDEKPTIIPIKGEINEPIIFDAIIDSTRLNFYTEYPDSLLSCKHNSPSYRHGDKITIDLEFELVGSHERYVSAFLIDSNNFVRMSFPTIDSSEINKILTGDLSIEDIIINDSYTKKDINTTLQLNLYTKEYGNMISKGLWRFVVLIWRTQTSETIMPTLMITETINLEKYDPSEDILTNQIPAILAYITSELIIILISYYTYHKSKKRGGGNSETREEGNQEIEEEHE